MCDCPREAQTQHHLGVDHGYGVVHPDEVVVFAVFGKTPTSASRLQATAFDTNQLKRFEQSVCRLLYTTLLEFQNGIVDRLVPSNGELVGVSIAQVARIRQISLRHDQIAGKAVCVIDRVVQGDIDSHAAMGYSTAQQNLGEKQKKGVRFLIAADLADTFSAVQSVEVTPWRE